MSLMNLLRPVRGPMHTGILRLGVHGFSAVHNWRRRKIFRDVHRQPARTFYPVGICRILRRPLPPAVADTMFDATQVVNALAFAGVAHRITGPANALLQLWTLTYRNSFGMILHNDNMLLMQQIALGLGPSADAVSLSPRRNRQASRSHGATVTMANVAAVSVYFISGVAKVRSSYGWRWASGVALREQIAADAIRKEAFGAKAPSHARRAYLAREPVGVLAAGALAVELLAPLALLDRRLGYLFALSAWAMHWGIWFVMGIRFSYNMSGISYVGFVR